MTRRLSSRWTVFHKFILPVLWIGGFGFGTSMMFLFPDSDHGKSESDAKWIFLISWVFYTVYLCLTGIRFKKVDLNGTMLTISNYFREVQIPLKEINTISTSVFPSPEDRIYLRLHSASAFGATIVFTPRLRMGIGPKAFAAELRTLVSRARDEAQ